MRHCQSHQEEFLSPHELERNVATMYLTVISLGPLTSLVNFKMTAMWKMRLFSTEKNCIANLFLKTNCLLIAPKQEVSK